MKQDSEPGMGLGRVVCRRNKIRRYKREYQGEGWGLEQGLQGVTREMTRVS